MKAKRHNRMALAALGGAGTAAILFCLPTGFLETVVASSGLSETLPLAAPPLGLKARLLLTGFGALMAMGLIWVSQYEGEDRRGMTQERRNGAQGAGKMGFALSKLSWLTRGQKRRTGGIWTLRRADAHPDAPPRTPIFASRDFNGLEIFSPGLKFGGTDDEGAMPLLSGPDLPNNGAVMSDPAAEPVDAEFEEVHCPASTGADQQRDSVYALSIAELTARFEQGLARRKRSIRPSSNISVLADMPVEAPVPVRESVDEHIDEALRSALGTLRSMAGRR